MVVATRIPYTRSSVHKEQEIRRESSKKAQNTGRTKVVLNSRNESEEIGTKKKKFCLRATALQSSDNNDRNNNNRNRKYSLWSNSDERKNFVTNSFAENFDGDDGAYRFMGSTVTFRANEGDDALNDETNVWNKSAQMFSSEPQSLVERTMTSSSTFFKTDAREKWKKSNKFPVLFYCKEHEPLAKKIADLEEFSVELGTINWESFNDGFPDLFINDAYDIRDRHVAFLASFHTPEVIFEQLSIIYSLPKMFVASFTLVLPFFPTGTAERVAVEGEVATAVTLARMLSSTPPSRGGPTSAVIFDIHALQERFYFGDAILPCFESGIPMLLKRLLTLDDAKNVVIAYPDEGAYKRFHSFFDRAGYESVVCTKVRKNEKRIVKLKEGEPAGRHCIIVDDLVQSGGTLIECQTLLLKLGATKVSAYVTHGVFPNKSWKRFTSEGAGGQGFSNFWITDSCPTTVKEVEGLKPFEVLSLARRIAKSLQI